LQDKDVFCLENCTSIWQCKKLHAWPEHRVHFWHIQPNNKMKHKHQLTMDQALIWWLIPCSFSKSLTFAWFWGRGSLWYLFFDTHRPTIFNLETENQKF
jgi:hypothetical protein